VGIIIIVKGYIYYAIITFGKCTGINQISVFALENGAGPSLLPYTCPTAVMSSCGQVELATVCGYLGRC